jgi:hypothetical protein
VTKAGYLTTVKNSAGNPEQVTTERTTAQVWGHRDRRRDLPLERRPLPIRALHRYLDLKEQDLGLRGRPGNTAATVKIAISRCVCSCSILSTTAVNRGVSGSAASTSNRYQERKEIRYESHDDSSERDMEVRSQSLHSDQPLNGCPIQCLLSVPQPGTMSLCCEP